MYGIDWSIIIRARYRFLGVFPFLRQQSLLSDALSHAMLPGIATSFLISGGKQNVLLLCGAMIGGCAVAWIFMMLERHTRLKQDALLGTLLSSFFGLGLLFVTAIQKKAYTNSAIVQRFFFGNASTIVSLDIWTIIILGIMCITIILCLWKEIKLVLFDSLYAQSLGYPVALIERVLTGVFIVTLALGLSLVGVILMSSFLIAPVAAARQWVQSMYPLCIVSSMYRSIFRNFRSIDE